MISIRAKLRDSTRITAAGDIRSAKGPFLYSCNQRGDNIAVFRVNRKTGGLIFTGHYTPVCKSFGHRFPRSREGGI